MTDPIEESSDLARLKAVQSRVRELALNDPSFAEAIRKAYSEFDKLYRRNIREMSAFQDRKTDLARDLLARGYLYDPEIQSFNNPILIKDIEGLCPAELAEKLGKYGMEKHPPPDLQRRGAKAALAALDHHEKFQSRELAQAERDRMVARYQAKLDKGTHVRFSWRIVIAQPHLWQKPPDPSSLRREYMCRFEDSERITIILYYLGGLADAGARCPIIPQPEETGDIVQDHLHYLHWRGRFPGADPDNLNPAYFDFEVAREMLGQAVAWHRDRRDAGTEDGQDRAARVGMSRGLHRAEEADLPAGLGMRESTGSADPTTPTALRTAIEDHLAYLDSLRRPNGDAGYDDALRDAANRWYQVAVHLRAADQSLPALPPPTSDPLAMMNALREWCIGTVAHDGVERPSPDGQADGNNHAPPNWRDASWFQKATQDGIYAALLRNARARERIRGIKHHNRWRYSPESVAREWPEYRKQIEAHTESERNQA